MPEPTGIKKVEKTYYATDGHDRGPLTVSRVCFHPQQAQLVAACADRRLMLFDLAAVADQEVKGRGRCVVGQLVCPHEAGWIRGVDVSPDGRWVATGGSDRTLRLWAWSDGRPADEPARQVAAHDGWVEAVAFSPDAELMATAGADGAVKLWKTDGLVPLKSLPAHRRYIADLRFSPDGRLLLSGGEDGRIVVHDARTWSELRVIEFGDANDQFGQNPRHSGVHRLALSGDSRWLAAAGGNKLELYDVESGQLTATERLNMDVAFHPRANLVAAGESEVKFWSFEPTKLIPPPADRSGKPQPPSGIPGKLLASAKRGDWSLGVGFAPDGRQVALGKADGTVEVYDVV
jgi:WD40 repeat protein